MNKPGHFIFALCLLAASTAVFANASPVVEKIYRNDKSGLLSWLREADGFRVEFIQLLPDFVRAVYARHGFPEDAVEEMASWCIFGSIIKNTSGRPLRYRVADWRYRDSQGRLHPVKTKTQWLREWRRKGIPFSWSLLPDKGDFAAGDWQQGFTTLALPHGASFDLLYSWSVDGRPYQGEIKQMRCAPARLEIQNEQEP